MYCFEYAYFSYGYNPMKINTALTWLFDFWILYILCYFFNLDKINEYIFIIGVLSILGLISAGKMMKLKIGENEIHIEDDNEAKNDNVNN